MESEIQKHPDVRIALIGGQGRPRPFLIIDLLENALPPESEKEPKLTGIWPYIVTANERCSDYVKLTSIPTFSRTPDSAKSDDSQGLRHKAEPPGKSSSEGIELQSRQDKRIVHKETTLQTSSTDVDPSLRHYDVEQGFASPVRYVHTEYWEMRASCMY
ncbi:MAG: hypothetical protein M1830_009558 [Pleopsidium flavum]|nr:MAG: hypothetical protein M1830_009558 [Pleopsidium flavum]